MYALFAKVTSFVTTAGPGRDYVYAGVCVVILKCHPRKQDAGFANVHNRKRRNFTLQEERQLGTRDMRAQKPSGFFAILSSDRESTDAQFSASVTRQESRRDSRVARK